MFDFYMGLPHIRTTILSMWTLNTAQGTLVCGSISMNPILLTAIRSTSGNLGSVDCCGELEMCQCQFELWHTTSDTGIASNSYVKCSWNHYHWGDLRCTLTSKKAEPNVGQRLTCFRNPTLASSGERTLCVSVCRNGLGKINPRRDSCWKWSRIIPGAGCTEPWWLSSNPLECRPWTGPVEPTHEAFDCVCVCVCVCMCVWVCVDVCVCVCACV